MDVDEGPLGRALAMWKGALPDLEAPTIEDFRSAARRFGLALRPQPMFVQEAADLGGVKSLWLRRNGHSPERVIVYVHGGGFLLGQPDEFVGLGTDLGRVGEADVVVPGYRLAPEDPHPAAVDDVAAALTALAGSQVVLVAESAGAAIALAALLRLRDAGEDLPRAVVLFSPWVDLTLTGASMEANVATDPVIRRASLDMMAFLYASGADPRSPDLSPLFGDLRGLPPMLLQVGAGECLLDDARRLAARAREHGVDVTLEENEGMPHVYQYFASFLPAADIALERVGVFLRTAWSSA